MRRWRRNHLLEWKIRGVVESGDGFDLDSGHIAAGPIWRRQRARPAKTDRDERGEDREQENSRDSSGIGMATTYQEGSCSMGLADASWRLWKCRKRRRGDRIQVLQAVGVPAGTYLGRGAGASHNCLLLVRPGRVAYSVQAHACSANPGLSSQPLPTLQCAGCCQPRQNETRREKARPNQHCASGRAHSGPILSFSPGKAHNYKMLCLTVITQGPAAFSCPAGLGCQVGWYGSDTVHSLGTGPHNSRHNGVRSE